MRGLIARFGGAAAGRRIVLHVGPHRTGTSTIQRTLQLSAAQMPERARGVTRADQALKPVRAAIYGLGGRAAAKAAAPEIRARAATFAQSITHEVALVSDEDLLGPLPTRKATVGLYPHLGLTLPPLIAGFRTSGAQVTVAIYRRDFDDWLESIFFKRHDGAPPHDFNAAEFRQMNGLPHGWSGFDARLRRAARGARLAQLDFAADAREGPMGASLFRLAGLSEAEIAALRHAAPRNVSRGRLRKQ